MALLDFLKEMDPERAKVALRLNNIKNIPLDGAAKAITPVVERPTPILESLNRPLDVIKGVKKAGGVTGSVVRKTAPVLLNPTVMRGAGAVQAGFGVADAAKNGLNLQNATDIAAGGLQTYNPALGVPLNTGVLGGKLLVTGADKLGLLDPLKPKPAVQGPEFAAAQAKFNADPRAVKDLGYVTPSSPIPQIDFTNDQLNPMKRDATAMGVNAFNTDYLGPDGLVRSRTIDLPAARGAGGVSGGGGGGARVTTPILPQPAIEPEEGVLVDRGGVLSMDNFYGDRNYTLPNESPENRAANIMRLLSNTAQEAYNDTTIRSETLEPVRGVNRFGEEETQYVRRTNVTPGLNIASPLQQQIGGVAPIPYAERIAAEKNATDIAQQQIAAGATTGAAAITANASMANNENSLDAVKARIINSAPAAKQAELAASLGAYGAGAKQADKLLPVFNKALLETTLPLDKQQELYAYINDPRNSNATGADLLRALRQFEFENEKQ